MREALEERPKKWLAWIGRWTVHPDDQEFMRAEYARMVAEGRTVSEVRGIRKDGSCFHKEVAMVRLLDADNLFLGHFCFMKDISVRKAALAALEESETRFRAAIEAMQEGFVIQDANGAIYLNNHSAEAILGLSADQLNGRTSFDPCWRAIHEDGSDFPGEQHPAIRALRDGVALHNVIMGIERPTGETVWVSINAAPLYRPKEWKPYSAVATFADVTAQRQTQEQIDTYIVSVNDMCGALEAQKAALEQQKNRSGGAGDYRRSDRAAKPPRLPGTAWRGVSARGALPSAAVGRAAGRGQI